MPKPLILLLFLVLTGTAQGQSIEEEALDWLQAFIKIDTQGSELDVEVSWR